MNKQIPTVTMKQIQLLLKSGELERIYRWLVKRVQEYELQLDIEGDFGHDGELMTKGKVVTTLKRDLRNAIERGEFPPLPNAIIDHCVKHALKKLTERAMIQMQRMDNQGEYKEEPQCSRT